MLIYLKPIYQRYDDAAQRVVLGPLIVLGLACRVKAYLD
jgi:hypothetical protein